MKNKNFIVTLSIAFAVLSLCAGESAAQINEEKAEKSLEISKIERPRFRVYSSAAQFIGYDSNVLLQSESKGAMFEETIYSFGLHRPLDNNMGMTFNYDVDYINYNSSISATNLLNHLRLSLYKKQGPFQAGGGYDFSYSYFPHEAAGDFFFHKGFVYLKNFLNRKLYHQVMFEYGYKPHVSRKALGDTISTFQDKAEVEKRSLVEYAIVYQPLMRLSLDLRARFFKNDANDRYLDFYDYSAYELSPRVRYIFNPRTDAVLNFVYLNKDYKTRTVTNETDKEEDDTYAANFILRYKLNSRNIVSLNYSYRDNSSNDNLQRYNENIFSLGWQYDF